MSPFGVRQRSLQTRQRPAPLRYAYDQASHQERCVARQCFWACSAWSSSHRAFAIVFFDTGSFTTSLQGRYEVKMGCINFYNKLALAAQDDPKKKFSSESIERSDDFIDQRLHVEVIGWRNADTPPGF